MTATDDTSPPEAATTRHAEADDYTTSTGTALAVALLVALVTAGYVLLIRAVQQSPSLGRTLPFLADTVGRSFAWLGAYALVAALGRRFAPGVEEFQRQSAVETVGRLVVVTIGSAFVVGATLEITGGAIDVPVYLWFGGGAVTLVAVTTFFVLVFAPDLGLWVSIAETLGKVLIVGVVVLAAFWWESTNASWGLNVWVTRWVFTPVAFVSFGVYYLVAFADASQRADGDGVGALAIAALVALVESHRGPTDFLGLIDPEEDEDAETAT